MLLLLLSRCSDPLFISILESVDGLLSLDFVGDLIPMVDYPHPVKKFFLGSSRTFVVVVVAFG